MMYLLGAVIAVLLIERYFAQRQHNKQIDDFIKALLSKDINDYIHGKVADKQVKVDKEPEPDLVPMSTLDNGDFMKIIQKQNGTK